MIVQACLNGTRTQNHHPGLPITTGAMAADAVACIKAGASELHIHPRGADGSESLDAVNDVITAIRQACPGTFVGVSTGAWIENSVEKTRNCIAGWQKCPDYASVNLSEPDAPAVMDLLESKSVGIEAGLATVEDAKRFIALPVCHRVLRVLIEIREQDPDKAIGIAEKIAQTLDEKDVRRPVLLHGFDNTVWHLIRYARKKCWSTRVGLEDGKLKENGSLAYGNAELVSEAVRIFRTWPN